MLAGSFLCLFFLPQVASAQDTTMVTTVTHVAGANVYLDLGTNQGVETGDTLLVQRNNEIVGQLKVLSVSSKQSVVAFVGKPFQITRASKLTVLFNTAGSNQRMQTADAFQEEEDRPAPVERSTPSSRRSSFRPDRIRLQGRIMLNMSVMSSETKPLDDTFEPTKRTFITPSLNLNTTVSNLPSGVRLRLNVRSDYRYNSATTLARQNIVRTYQLSLEKDLPFGEFQLGRFYNRLTPTGGYWDGVSFLYGSRKKGIGASVGFMPDRSNEGFTTQFPRFSGFAHLETSRKSGQPYYQVSASYHEVQPSSDYLDHKFFGVEQTFSWGIFSLTQDLQLDKDPETQGWVASNFRANARLKITDWLTLRNRYTVRQPYRMYSTASPISIRRDQIQTTLNFQLLDARFGVSYTTRYTRQQYESRTYTAYATSPPLTMAQFSLFGSYNFWESSFGSALYLNGGINKPIGPAMIRLDYGFYRSTNENQVEPIDLSRYTFSTTLPFGKKVYANFRTSLQQSQYLNSITFNTSLQYRF